MFLQLSQLLIQEIICLVNHVGLITDGRFSGGTHGLFVGHVAPEAAVGGTIALVEENDLITIDVDAGVYISGGPAHGPACHGPVQRQFVSNMNNSSTTS